jgi:hypothetical protein
MEHIITTEKNIRARMECVVPSRALFEDTLQRVTKEQSERSLYMKATPSPYQTFLLRITARTTKVGVSIALVTLIAVLALKTGIYDTLQHRTQVQSGITTPVAADIPQTEDISADQIVATLIDDADTEATLGASEEEDGTALTKELDSYTII